MNNTANIRLPVILALAAVVGLLVAGRFLGWYGGGKPVEVPAETAVAEPPVEPAPVPAPPAPPPSLVNARPAPRETKPVALPVPAPAATVTPPGDAAMLEWSARIDDVLREGIEEPQKAKKLLELLPTLPADGQVEAAQHISNLLPDEDYPLLRPALTNAATSRDVIEVLLADVLNRPNALKLPTLLDIARVENHPNVEEAREILELFVDANHGTDWAKWTEAVQNWLKENPD
jgi:hypothetical protein